jgi:hypothetical protein
MASNPFNGAQDENLAVGYIAAFILVFSVSTLITYYLFAFAHCNGCRSHCSLLEDIGL